MDSITLLFPQALRDLRQEYDVLVRRGCAYQERNNKETLGRPKDSKKGARDGAP